MLTVTADHDGPPDRIDRFLAQSFSNTDHTLSRSRIKALIVDQQLTENGRTLSDPSAPVKPGAQYRLTVPPPIDATPMAEPIALDILYEDKDLIVLNKPAGMVVHPAPGSPRDTLVNALLHHCADSLSGIGGEKRPGIVHRIDKDTSGLLVVAKNDRAHHGLAQQFERHSVERYYRALCFGVPDANDPRVRGVRGVNFEPGNIMKITTHLARHKTDRQRQAVLFDGGRHAVTRVRIVDRFGTPPVVSLVECWLETGRTHQIRVHMAHTGHGLVGDPVYGGRRKISHKSLTPNAVQAIQDFDRQALHAAVLGFEHPVSGEMMRFEADLPTDMITLLSNL